MGLCLSSKSKCKKIYDVYKAEPTLEALKKISPEIYLSFLIECDVISAKNFILQQQIPINLHYYIPVEYNGFNREITLMMQVIRKGNIDLVDLLIRKKGYNPNDNFKYLHWFNFKDYFDYSLEFPNVDVSLLLLKNPNYKFQDSYQYIKYLEKILRISRDGSPNKTSSLCIEIINRAPFNFNWKSIGEKVILLPNNYIVFVHLYRVLRKFYNKRERNFLLSQRIDSPFFIEIYLMATQLQDINLEYNFNNSYNWIEMALHRYSYDLNNEELLKNCLWLLNRKELLKVCIKENLVDILNKILEAQKQINLDIQRKALTENLKKIEDLDIQTLDDLREYYYFTDECCICNDKMSQTVKKFHCFHLQTCIKCIENIDKCPICRSA